MKLTVAVLGLLFTLVAGANETALNGTASNRAFFDLVGEDVEKFLDTDSMIRWWGYPAESHEIFTEDGYILKIFRIPRKKDEPITPTTPRPVILIQHGLVGSSSMWTTNLPHQDVSYTYADAGVDVWLGNFRGSDYGKRHVKLDPKADKKEFWDFSWPEMAKYDLPAMINYILNKTGAPFIYYMGHSMGTLTAFVQFSQDKELGKKIKHFYALAPVMKLDHAKGAVGMLSPIIEEIDAALWFAGMEQFVPPKWLMKKFGQYVCGSAEVVGDVLCSNMMFAITGPGSKHLNVTRFPVYSAHFPAPTSRRTFIHLGQMANNGKICQYDHGRRKNKKKYGTQEQPEYDITGLEVPLDLWWGGNDWLANDEDVRIMIPKLKSVVAQHYMPDYNHVDFLWGLKTNDQVYKPILADIQQDFAASMNATAKA